MQSEQMRAATNILARMSMRLKEFVGVLGGREQTITYADGTTQTRNHTTDTASVENIVQGANGVTFDTIEQSHDGDKINLNKRSWLVSGNGLAGYMDMIKGASKEEQGSHLATLVYTDNEKGSALFEPGQTKKSNKFGGINITLTGAPSVSEADESYYKAWGEKQAKNKLTGGKVEYVPTASMKFYTAAISGYNQQKAAIAGKQQEIEALKEKEAKEAVEAELTEQENAKKREKQKFAGNVIKGVGDIAGAVKNGYNFGRGLR